MEGFRRLEGTKAHDQGEGKVHVRSHLLCEEVLAPRQLRHWPDLVVTAGQVEDCREVRCQSHLDVVDEHAAVVAVRFVLAASEVSVHSETANELWSLPVREGERLDAADADAAVTAGKRVRRVAAEDCACRLGKGRAAAAAG